MKIKTIIISTIALSLLFASCEWKHSNLPQEEITKYQITFDNQSNIDKNKITEAPMNVSVLGQDFKCEWKDDFNYTEKTKLEEKWYTHKNGCIRKAWDNKMGGNYWDDIALNMVTDQNDGNKPYLAVQTVYKPWKEMGIYDGLTGEALTQKKAAEAKKATIDENAKYVASGAMYTHERFVYGLYVARIRQDRRTAGQWNAFWTYNSQYEFDIFEYSQFRGSNLWQQFDHTTHYLNFTKEWKEKGGKSQWTHCKRPIVDDLSQWHTFAVLWTPEEYVYYIDWVPTYYVAKYKDGSYGGRADKAMETEIKKLVDREIIPVPEPTKIYFSSQCAYNNSGYTSWTGKVDIKQIEQQPDSLDVDYCAWYTSEELKAVGSKIIPAK